MKTVLSETELRFCVAHHLRAAGRAIDQLLKKRGVRSAALDQTRANIEREWWKAVSAVAAEVWKSRAADWTRN